jgi:hypothetical protein
MARPRMVRITRKSQMNKQSEFEIRISELSRVFLWIRFIFLLSMITVFPCPILGLGLYDSIVIMLKYNNIYSIVACLFLLTMLVFFCVLSCLLVYDTKHFLQLQKIKVYFLGDHFTFSFKDNFQLVKCSQVLYAWRGPTKITIILKGDDSIWSFSFMRMIYGKQMLRRIECVLRKMVSFLDDPKQIRQVVKEHKLDNLFHKKRFEFVLCSQE